jgi:hypothetical protein
LLTAKDFVDKEFQPKFLCDALYGSSFGSSWLQTITPNKNKNFIAFFITTTSYDIKLANRELRD